MAERLEAHQVAEPMMTIVGAKRPAPMVAAMLPLLGEALDGGNDTRRTFMDMIVPASAGMAEVSVIVHEGYRIWMYVLAELVVRLPPDFQGAASAWLGDFITDWMREVEAHLHALRAS
ncbi:MAG: hypothetical protein KDK70_39520 [Myxococcales bacterium]|nr:hypothetical protein [Myxococcales bacterium]